jgi:hypothetical protein
MGFFGFAGYNRYYAAAKTASVGVCTFALSLGARYLGSPAVFATDRPRGRRAWFRTLVHRMGMHGDGISELSVGFGGCFYLKSLVRTADETGVGREAPTTSKCRNKATDPETHPK